ncbi:MAG: hypothetical protein J0H31_21965 [Alphaproteobacteria bacterium]|nr:hypothetical protein [Alphaproteobacteria bacterium]
MSPKQKELLIKAQLSRVFLRAGEYTTANSCWRKGWLLDPWQVGPGTVTPAGLAALKHDCKPIEIFQDAHGDVLLVNGQPIARVLPGKRKQMETILARN